MDPLETYQSDAMERPVLRRRLFWALVVSLILHLGLVLWLHQKHLAQFNAPVERLVPRIFNIKTIYIDEKALEGEEKDQGAPKANQQSEMKPLAVPDDKPLAELSEGKMTPAAPPTPDLVKPLAMDKPIAEPNNVQAITEAQQNSAKVMQEDLDKLKDSLLKDQPANLPHSLIKLPGGQEANMAQSDAAGMAAASGQLDSLLSHGLHPGNAPVTMPGGALFEFGSADLRTESVEQLRKLGELIKMSPNVTFTIEGYTDSFGDAAYNNQLSQDRADAVRTWLIQNMDVDPSHIQAIGYGATNFLVTPKPVDMRSQASIDQEKLLEQSNRRVEIPVQISKGAVISGVSGLSPSVVADHYDELDQFYREIWGDHVHHGLWLRGGETHHEATLQLVRHVAARARIGNGTRVCDIGCGYGATARMLAADYGAEVTGVTVSPAQFQYARGCAAPGVSIVLGDWLRTPLGDRSFDAAIAIESSEHMPDLEGFFRQASRVLRPGGRLVVCSWLAHPRASATQRKLLLEPACREGRMARIGLFAEYRRLFEQTGFTVEHEEDLSRQVKRTWPVCAGRFATRLMREPRYLRFLVNRHRRNRVFALTIFRIWLAFETGALRYGILTGLKNAV